MKDKMMVLSVAAAIELLVFLAAVKLSDISLLFWIAAGAALAAAAVTGVFLFSATRERISERNRKISEDLTNLIAGLTEKNSELEKNISDALELSEENSKSISTLSDDIKNLGIQISDGNKRILEIQKENISSLCKTEEEYGRRLSELLSDNSNKLREDMMLFSGKLAVLSEAVTDSSKKSSEDTVRFIGNMDEQYQRISDTFSDNVSHYVGEAVKELCRVYDKTSGQMISATEQRIDMLDNCIGDMLDSASEMLTSRISELSEKQIETQNQLVSGLSEETRNLTQSLTEKTEAVLNSQRDFVELVRSGNEDTRSLINAAIGNYSQSVEQVSRLISDYTGQMKQHSEQELTKLSDSLSDHFNSTVSGISEENKTLTNELGAKLNEMAQNQSERIEQSVKSGVQQYIEVGQRLAEKTEAVLNSQRDFVELVKSGNEDTRSLINAAIGNYSQSVEQVSRLISDYTGQMKQHSEQELTKLSDSLSDHFNSTVSVQTEQLNKSMKVISDDFVKLSAEAVASVQEKNDEQLCRAADSIKELADKTNSIISDLETSDKAISDRIEQLTGEIGRITGIQQSLNKELIETLSKSIGEIADEKLRDTVESYKNAISDYTDAFVKANADALAEVEKENVETIAKAHQSVQDLTKAMGLFMNSSSDFNNKLKKMLEDSDSRQADQFEDFSSKFDEKVRKLSKSLTTNFEEHSKEVSSIQAQIIDITKNYEKLFQKVMDNQKNMQAMTDSDMEILKKLIK